MRKKPKTNHRSPKDVATIERLWLRPDLSIVEAMLLTGRSRARIGTLIEQKRWLAYHEGKRLRIITQSIRDDMSRKAEETLREAS